MSEEVMTEPTEMSTSTGSLPLSSSGQPPLIVTLAPKSSSAEKELTDEDVSNENSWCTLIWYVRVKFKDVQ